jgi:membrane-bound lytic murein transglycosylase D
MRKYRVALVLLSLCAVALGVLFAVTHKSKLELLEMLRKEGQSLEESIASAGSDTAKLALIRRLNKVVLERERLLASLPESERPARSFVEGQVIRLMERFRETSYAVPEIFIQRVSKFVAFYTEDPRGRAEIALGMKNGSALLPKIFGLFEAKKLPGELAYIGFVESKFDAQAENSRSGARGIWQLMPAVAREQGLVVDAKIDERSDFEKSTLAARGLLLNLVSVYGVRSFMLVLAAYNAGDANIRYRLKKLEDPIEQRDFWTMVRLGLLREETNDYIPKFVAATIVFEHLEKFGFRAAAAGQASQQSR